MKKIQPGKKVITSLLSLRNEILPRSKHDVTLREMVFKISGTREIPTPWRNMPRGKRNPDTLFMETTTISPDKTVAEIQQLLGQNGATAVMTEYDPNGEVLAVSFKVRWKGKEIPFRLPSNWEAVRFLLKNKTTKDLDGQAKRTAWRCVLRWVEAQMALIKTGQVELPQVFLPYLQTGLNQTLYDLIRAKDYSLEFKP